MSEVVIRAEGLSKRYTIGHQAERYVALRDVLARSARNLVRSAGDMVRGRPLVRGREIEEFWALKDADFEIKRGEVIGIIGRNGAGKSTLLKVLSRITEPTTGRVEILGRVASLLEVGTGFHPELTGRENIFLNGAILGMSRTEIKRKFDEIVVFAEVDRFLDTPVKRYSSGMYVRLAFAVAAHLEPEILVVDEVLAVGDAEFQRKCLGKMKNVAGDGRTVLFVSHNVGAVSALCSSCMLLAGGRIQRIGAPTEVLATYMTPYREQASARKTFVAGPLTIESFAIADKIAGGAGAYRKDAEIELSVSLHVSESDPLLHLGYALYSDVERPLWWSFFGDRSGEFGLQKGSYRLSTTLPRAMLNDGSYVIELIAARHNQSWLIEPGRREIHETFTVEGGDLGNSMLSGTKRPGFLMPAFEWKVERASPLHV